MPLFDASMSTLSTSSRPRQTSLEARILAGEHPAMYSSIHTAMPPQCPRSAHINARINAHTKKKWGTGSPPPTHDSLMSLDMERCRNRKRLLVNLVNWLIVVSLGNFTVKGLNTDRGIGIFHRCENATDGLHDILHGLIDLFPEFHNFPLLPILNLNLELVLTSRTGLAVFEKPNFNLSCPDHNEGVLGLSKDSHASS